MAGSSDARISVALPAHPKTKKLIRRLGDSGAWAMIRLFLWATANRPNGRLDGLSDEDIELAIDWAGDEGAFVATMAEVQFLDGGPGARRIHDWEEHNPWANGAPERSAKARWNAVKRHHGQQAADRQVPEWAAIRNAGGSAAADPDDAGSNASSTASSMHAAQTICAERIAPSPSPSPSPSLIDAAEAPASSANKRGSRLPDDWQPTPDELRWAKGARPDIDAMREVEKFRDYWRAKPGKDGLKLDWQATFRNWIRSAQAPRGDLFARNADQGAPRRALKEL